MMGMEIIGKTNPNKDQIEQRAKEGFRKFELYTTKEFFAKDQIEKFRKLKDSLGAEIISVHTPHVELKVLKQLLPMIDYAAEKLGAEHIVMHSSFIRELPEEFLNLITGNKIIENTLETNADEIQRLTEEGFNFCLDIAHLFRNSLTEKYDYYQTLEDLLVTSFRAVKLIHFCNDDLKLGNQTLKQGLIDIEKAFNILQKYYDGCVVIEVPIEMMKKDRDYLVSLMKFKKKRS